jgi:hypothetical protein
MSRQECHGGLTFCFVVGQSGMSADHTLHPPSPSSDPLFWGGIQKWEKLFRIIINPATFFIQVQVRVVQTRKKWLEQPGTKNKIPRVQVPSRAEQEKEIVVAHQKRLPPALLEQRHN